MAGGFYQEKKIVKYMNDFSNEFLIVLVNLTGGKQIYL